MVSKPITFESSVHPGEEGQPLSAWLSRRFAYRSAGQWLEEIRQGHLVVNGKPGLADQVMASGDEVAWTTDIDEPPVNDQILTLYEDEAMLVVHKPSPLPCHAKAPYFRNTLIAIMRERRGEPGLKLAHRLDSGTSGVLVLARDSLNLGKLMRQFERRQVNKTYLAVCQGDIPWQEKDLDAPLAQVDHEGLTRWEVSSEGKACKTHFKLLERQPGLSLVQASPQTGRTHQIRAHLAHLGFPISGDPLYDSDLDDIRAHRLWLKSDGKEGKQGHFGSRRLMLHAWKLSLKHPMTGQPMEFCADPDDAFQFSAEGHAR